MARRQRIRAGLHRWMDDACLRCGLHRREVWLLDDRGREVMALVWSDRDGDLRLQPFPPMKGLEAPQAPTQTRVEAFGNLPVGPEPTCGPVPAVDDATG
ncbi:hypothetical protein G5V58_04400 [Nocardioides anomalus]|uniref:Uncharacterized protein n=1 Tax=Nocardioides anomalus TaxID=2712223 RepID=A0A6G6WA58_9ACTN|nr:hypothetical protein [Nocardioides anomalus]QIG42112.1 hypothetical protein G5V58_04400 [Nocardioides anomalus]